MTRNPTARLLFTRAKAVTRGVALAVFSSACATYSDKIDGALQDFQRGQFEKSIRAFEDTKTTGSSFLSGAEAGTVALAAGDWERAIQQLDRAALAARDAEERALFSPERLGETLETWVLNEGASEYQGEGYERVQLHAGLALAYLAKGDLEGALVEVRRSNALLESEEKLYDKSYAAGGLGHVLSAIAYELDGKLDDAYIDYKRMADKGVGMDLAGRALVRLAKRQQRDDDLRMWIEKFGDVTDAPADSASIIVIAGVGLGAYKRDASLPIPTSDGLLQWSIPVFERRAQPLECVTLEVEGGSQGARTVVVENVADVARENLSDRIVWLAAKSTVRAFLKRELTQNLEEEAGIWGRIAGDVFAIVTERADLRSWQTLPDTWQAARAFVPPGAHALTLSASDGQRRGLGTFSLGAGETMFVLVRTVGSTVHAHTIGGQSLVEEVVEPPAHDVKEHSTP